MSPPRPSARILQLAAARVLTSVQIRLEDDLLTPRRLPAAANAAFLRPRGHFLFRARGKSRDRLEAWGEEFCDRHLVPRLRPEGVARIRRALSEGKLVVLESRGLDHAIRPLARRLGVTRIVARRLQFRDGVATGRLLRALESIDLDPAPRPGAVLVDDPGDATLRPGSLSVRRALAGKRILVAGGSGFLGKVWLAKLLHDLPEIGDVTVLIRRRGEVPATERFRDLLETCPVFDPLRESPSDDLSRLLARVHVVEGDVARRDLGLDEATREALQSSVDLVVSFAGHTDFNPDLRDALAVNVEATLHLVDFLRGCRDAGLLHMSTCFVAGARDGRVAERVTPFVTPLGRPLDPEAERRHLHEMIESSARLARAEGARARPFRRALIEAGRERARELGWPNIYTFTKALGEALLVTRGADLAITVVRPSVVETSIEFPRCGWAEGVNTSAPLSYLLGTPFRHLPVNERKRLDVIPVDVVARGTTLVAAALAERRHDLVYQLATSVANPLDLRRAVELTVLAHRRHYREQPELKHRLLERMETIPVSRERYRRTSVPLQLRVVRGLNRVTGALFRGWRPLGRLERALRRVHDLIDLYEPFLLDNEPVFEADRIELLATALPEEELETFGYDVAGIDWYHYWVDIHIPALRHWSFPILEGRRVGDVSAPEPALATGPLQPAAVGAFSGES